MSVEGSKVPEEVSSEGQNHFFKNERINRVFQDLDGYVKCKC